jgi:hypothetical protein
MMSQRTHRVRRSSPTTKTTKENFHHVCFSSAHSRRGRRARPPPAVQFRKNL